VGKLTFSRSTVNDINLITRPLCWHDPTVPTDTREKGVPMQYMHVDGQVFSRRALTPPIINSEMATLYGIQVPCDTEPSQYSGPVVGNNVKLRLVIDNGAKKMTCHARIDWIEKDPDSDKTLVGFGHLSLTDDEFRVLETYFTEQPSVLLDFSTSVRDKAAQAETVKVSNQAKEIMRLKAVNFPVSLIEAIDENRGATPFSEFVATAVKEYLKR
jgi:hypothetical protein